MESAEMLLVGWGEEAEELGTVSERIVPRLLVLRLVAENSPFVTGGLFLAFAFALWITCSLSSRKERSSIFL